jgi:hypothetical protein
LQQNNLGGLRDLNADSGQALGFPYESQDFTVKVHVELVVVGVADD